MQAVLSAEKKMGTIEGANKQNVRWCHVYGECS